MTVFLDSSALVKRYAAEKGSDAVNRVVESGEDLYLSELTAVEVISALAKRVRLKEITRDDFENLKKTFLNDMINGIFFIVDFAKEDKGRAQGIISTYGLEKEARTLDCMIFSAVEKTYLHNPRVVLWSSDIKLLKIADHFHIKAANPADL